VITTALTDLFDLRHPLMLAPMGNVAGGLLAAAVSNAGGLGLVGGGYGDEGWLRTELTLVKQHTTRPWGAGLITWSVTRRALDQILDASPAAVMLSFGDPRPWAPAIREAGCRLICQVQDIDQALLARNAGADLIVAEGSEAGGHSGSRATLPLVPAVVDAVSPLPVIAAGGIADGRGLAAALMLGAHGALLGTRFCATTQSLLPDAAKHRIVAASGSDTVHTRVFDIVRGYDWPAEHPGRALRNRFTQQWHGREAELGADAAAQRKAYQAAALAQDYDHTLIWAGQAVDLIAHVEDAAVLVERISAEAEALLRHAPALTR
jgi:nitronate monooxygenase